MDLQKFFEAHRRVAVAFSGGVDSAYLLYTAKNYAETVRAYYVKSAFQPEFEFNDAVRLARELEVELSIIQIDVLNNQTITNNPQNRCYFCKQIIFSEIIKRASADGFMYLLDGTNASDDADDRPGMKALKELNVLSPLRKCGLTKMEIRRLSHEAGLFTWDKPSYACLATRIPVGCKITNERLVVIEQSENFMMSLGFKNFRVRLMENSAGKNLNKKPIAKIEITKAQVPLLLQHYEEINSKLKMDFDKVLLDLEMRNE